MALMAMLILAAGPLKWTFPWWLWFLAAIHTTSVAVTLKK